MLEKLADIILRCKTGAVLTGAGISAESGVPTFRGDEGLWKKFRPEQLASMDAFLSSPEVVWEWYNWRRELVSKVKPNPGHFALREIEELFDSFTLITQNVDNLHQVAGSSRVLELHGNIYRNKCVNCNTMHDPELEIKPDDIPKCGKCGGQIRPDVVWFGEMLPAAVIDEAFEKAEKADVFISVGTSALVQPAASLPLIAKQHGATLVEINPERTPLSDLADFHFPAKSGELLPELMTLLKEKTTG
ncbi:MAG: NAD-dependent protein deacylase [Candidatus Zixiibacteriota bacterium]|nr:MAG: NAD-dependent protein deacylase [candidate division Zixibacteria bacterium]